MNVEQYLAWNLIERQPEQMVVEEMSDSNEGLSIILRFPKSENSNQDGTKLRILFDPYISYRSMDESYRAKTIDKYPAGLIKTFYTVSNSMLITWLHEESKGIYSDRDIKHYSIVTIADWVDILSEFSPEVSWIE